MALLILYFRVAGFVALGSGRIGKLPCSPSSTRAKLHALAGQQRSAERSAQEFRIVGLGRLRLGERRGREDDQRTVRWRHFLRPPFLEYWKVCTRRPDASIGAGGGMVCAALTKNFCARSKIRADLHSEFGDDTPDIRSPGNSGRHVRCAAAAHEPRECGQDRQCNRPANDARRLQRLGRRIVHGLVPCVAGRHRVGGAAGARRSTGCARRAGAS